MILIYPQFHPIKYASIHLPTRKWSQSKVDEFDTPFTNPDPSQFYCRKYTRMPLPSLKWPQPKIDTMVSLSKRVVRYTLNPSDLALILHSSVNLHSD